MTLLSHYYQPGQDQAVTEAAMVDWVSFLSEYTQDQIERACRAYLEEFPRYRPGPGDIKRRIQKVALSHEPGGFSAKALPAPEAQRDRISGDRARQIMDEIGFTPKRMQQVQRSPMARSQDELDAPDTKPVKWSCETDAERLKAARMNNPLMREGMTDAD